MTTKFLGSPNFSTTNDSTSFLTSGSGEFIINCASTLSNLPGTVNNCVLIMGTFMDTLSPSVVGLIVAAVRNRNILSAVFIGAAGGSYQVSGVTTTTISVASTYSSAKTTFVTSPIVLS